jgi:hypothetical protein
MKESRSIFLIVFFLFLLLDLAVFVDIGSFLQSDFFLVLLVSCFQSCLMGCINIFPHFTNDLSQFSDLGIWIFGLDFAVDFFPVKEKG